ncbi:MAG: hypothetical protein FWD54_04520 [Endomicrobia bacterium]|nr:hypothetical protein [Endomicrobiia bacterium]
MEALNELETIVLIVSAIVAAFFLFTWYRRILSAWPVNRGKSAKLVLGVLPVLVFFMILYILETAASHDVVNDRYYINFYLALGFAWLYLGVIVMSIFFNLSWVDDILNMNNKAALFAFTGGFLGLTVIYAAANIGDGPGWGCVVFAGALGLISWILLALIMNLFTQAFERVTIERDVSCGIRLGSFLLAIGIILGRASSGDWTSAYMTIVEFMVGWPAIPLTLMAIIAELLFIINGKYNNTPVNNPSDSVFGAYPLPHNVITGGKNNISGSDVDISILVSSVLWGITLIIIAVISITILPSMFGK